MRLSAAAVCVEVGELLEQVCGTETLPGLKLSNNLQPGPQEQGQMNSPPSLSGGEESSQ